MILYISNQDLKKPVIVCDSHLFILECLLCLETELFRRDFTLYTETSITVQQIKMNTFKSSEESFESKDNSRGCIFHMGSKSEDHWSCKRSPDILA